MGEDSLSEGCLDWDENANIYRKAFLDHELRIEKMTFYNSQSYTFSMYGIGVRKGLFQREIALMHLLAWGWNFEASTSSFTSKLWSVGIPSSSVVNVLVNGFSLFGKC